MKEKVIDITKILGIMLILTFIISIPYLNLNSIFTHDISYHTNRIVEISNELKAGHFPVLIHSNLLDGFGYANSLFYPELFLYIPAILICFGVDFLLSYKLFIIITTFFTILFTYYSANLIFKKKNISWVITILYSMAFYRLTDIYERGAIGEVLALVFLPLIFAGLYEIIFGENKRWWVICFGIFGLVNSHVLSFAMAVIIILIICLINIKTIFKDKKRLINLLIAGIISILLTFSFVLPYLEQSNSDKFNVDERIYDGAFLQSYSVSLMEMINNKFYRDDFYKGIGIILLILPFFIFKCKDKNNEIKFLKQLFGIGFILLFLTSSLFPWETICNKFNFLTIIQFPYRLNVFITLLFSFVGGYAICSLFNNKEEFNNVIYIVMIFMTINLISQVNINGREFTADQILTFAPIGNGEYTPYGFNSIDKTVHNFSNNEIKFERNSSKITFDYNDLENEMKIHVPLAYYKGYKAYVEEKDGTKTNLKVLEDEQTKNVVISNDKIINGKITVEYKMTIIQILGYSITYITLIVLVSYIFYRKIRGIELK